MSGDNEVTVSVNFAELEQRTNTLRHKAESIIHTAKTKLEDAAKESGLPVRFSLRVGIDFPKQPDTRPQKPKTKEGKR